MPVRPPSDIHLTCVEHGVEFTTWTEAWGHQLDVHAGSQTVNWNLAGTVPE